MRQIILDTETTGLNPDQGDRIIEIGCVELIDRKLTGKTFHVYINPEREIDYGALLVHNISNEYLADKPKFAEIADEFLEFVSGAEIIAHNAPFDIGFLEYEFKLLAKKKNKTRILLSHRSVFDTLTLARKIHPGQKNNLDALCRRYNVDRSSRNVHGHGALIDAYILAEVYLRMTGGQVSLLDEIFPEVASKEKITTSEKVISVNKSNVRRSLPVILATSEELKLHKQILQKIKSSSGKCLWEEK